MSESNSDNKEIIEADAVVSESNADVTKVEKVTKAKKATKTKKIEEVAADDEVVVAPYITGAKDKAASTPSIATRTYLSIAAGVLLVVVLTAVTFFQDEVESVVASVTSITTADEVVSDSSASVQDADLAINNNVQMSDQIAQENYGYQPFAVNQDRNQTFNEMRQKQRAAYDEAMRMHNERMAGMAELRTATFKRMDQDRIDRQKKIEVMRTKTQQIQLEMQQKMQAAYDEFNSI